jgi:hypothetical protein
MNGSFERLRRRQLLAYGTLGIPGVLAACGQAPPAPLPPSYATGAMAEKEAALPAGALTLYMVTAPDCPICHEWEGSHGPVFQRSVARARLRFVILHSYTTYQGSGQDVTWPQDVRWLRDAAKADTRAVYLPLTRYTPLFVLARKHDYLLGAAGTKGWDTKIWPAILQETGAA